jgi:3-oxoacyl-[acyl-carrier protein] reductase
MPSVLVTGAGLRRGIAAACARKLAGKGWDVGLTYRRDFEDELLDELHGFGVRAEATEADLADPASPARIFDELEPRVGPFTALVAAHSHDVELSLTASSAEELDLHFAVNARAVALLIQEFARRLPVGDGRIVAFTSDALRDNVPYGVSKAALDRVVKAAAIELGPRGVRANCINPGPTETGWISDELRADVAGRSPLGRTSVPDDSANLVAYLLSPDGAWITGQLLHSNGGLQ